MDSLGEKVKELEVRIDELESQNKNLEETLKHQLDENDVRNIIEQVLEAKDIATESDIDLKINEYQITFIKWIIGTGVSITTILIGFARFFL